MNGCCIKPHSNLLACMFAFSWQHHFSTVYLTEVYSVPHWTFSHKPAEHRCMIPALQSNLLMPILRSTGSCTRRWRRCSSYIGGGTLWIDDSTTDWFRYGTVVSNRVIGAEAILKLRILDLLLKSWVSWSQGRMPSNNTQPLSGSETGDIIDV